MDNQELLQAISQMMDERFDKLKSELKDEIVGLKSEVSALKEDISDLQKDMSTVKEDISEIKENASITRHSVNLLLNWADKAENVVRVGLYE